MTEEFGYLVSDWVRNDLASLHCQLFSQVHCHGFIGIDTPEQESINDGLLIELDKSLSLFEHLRGLDHDFLDEALVGEGLVSLNEPDVATPVESFVFDDISLGFHLLIDKELPVGIVSRSVPIRTKRCCSP